MMRSAGAGVPSANRITLLRDTGRRRRRGHADGVPAGTQFAVRNGAGRQRSVRRLHRCDSALSLHAGRHARSREPGEKIVDLPAGTINHHWTKNVIASARRIAPVRHGRAPTAMSRRTAWRTRRAAPPFSRSISATAPLARLRVRAAESERPRLATADRRAVDGRQRARRARQRSRPRLSDVGEGRRLLRLAIQLLRRARRRARPAAAARPGGRSHCARLRARRARRRARA